MKQSSIKPQSETQASVDAPLSGATEPGLEAGLPPESPNGRDPLDPQNPPEIDEPGRAPGMDVPAWDEISDPGETPPEIDEPGKIPGKDVPDIEMPPPGVPDDEPDQELHGNPSLNPEARKDRR